MTVTIPDRSGSRWSVELSTVTIPDACPACGGPRGEPTEHQFFEDGVTFTVDRWVNPCGHVDLYQDVLKEAGV